MSKKLLALVFFLIIFFASSTDNCQAAGEFINDAAVEYNIQASGRAIVTHKITLENATPDFYATSYSFVLDAIEATNLKVFENGKLLKFDQTQEGTKTTIKFGLPNAVTGRGKSQTFIISFENNNFAQRTGEVWEISVPKLANEELFRNYFLTLSVPTSFGKLAYISPEPVNNVVSDDRLIYIFDKTTMARTGVNAGFGRFQVFSFNLTYHLENPLNRETAVEIAIPPDTSTQKIYYQVFDPQPENVYLDADGNWLAKINLSPRQRLDVKTSGSVQVFAAVAENFAKDKNIGLSDSYLKPSRFWQSDDAQIVALAQKYSTPKAIYDFVSTYLTYGYELASDNSERIGALAALASPNKATCMEFTDLFVAIARAAKIPAREINGFAYTENPKIQPLSLVADVLHAWPEYWDSQRQAWIPVDPTWAATTGGVDYFSKLDLRHFTFVIHGMDTDKPYPPGSYKLGPNPQKDVFVNFGQLTEKTNSIPKVSLTEKVTIWPAAQNFSIEIQNPGPVALYDLDLKIFYDDSLKSKKTFSALLPFAKNQATVTIPFNFDPNKIPTKLSVTLGNQTLAQPTFRSRIIFYDLLAVSLFIFLLVLILVIKYHKQLKIRLWSQNPQKHS